MPTGTAARVGLLVGLIAVVTAITAITHWPALSAQAYSFDDAQYLLKNPLVQDPGWASGRRFLVEVLEPSTVGGYYQPLAMISLMLDYALGGRPDQLRPFHRTSLALHVINTALVILLLYLLFEKPWPAAMVGLLFGVHPLGVEPIPWIGERKTLLGACFAILCLILYVLHTRGGPLGTRNAERGTRNTELGTRNESVRGRGFYALAILAFVLALMSKPTTTPLPALMLLLDYWPLRRLSRRSLLEKAPFFVLAGVSAIVTYISQARTASVTLPGERPAGWVPLTLCHNVIFYLYKIAWPANLSSHYPFPDPMSLAHPMIRAGVIGSAALVIVLLLSWRRTRAFVTGWAVFFVAIFPTLGIIGFSDVIASDKFAYLPSIGLMLVLAWGLARLWDPGSATRRVSSRRVAIAAAMMLIAGAEAVATRRYLAVWKNTDTFWNHMFARAPQVSVLRSNYAGFLIEAGRPAEAKSQCEQALDLNPDNYAAHNALGGIFMSENLAQAALGHFREALRLHPGDYVIHGNLATALNRLNNNEEAMTHYAEALRLKPASPEVHYNLAGALAQEGETDDALRHYAEAARLSPRWAAPYHRMGVLLGTEGRLEEAVERFAEAARLKPDWDEAQKNVAVTLAQLGRIDEAIEHYQTALRLNPAVADVHFNLANAYVLRGRSSEAIDHYREAVRLEPGDVQAHYNLAQALVKEGDHSAAITEYLAALGLKPEWAEAHNDVGVLLARSRRLDDAVAHFREAIRLRPDWTEARNNLALALGEAERR